MKILIAVVLILTALPAFADCEHILRINNIAVSVLDNSQVIQHPMTILRRRTNSGVCNNYRVYFSKGLGNSYSRKAFTIWGNASLSYNLHRNVNQSGVLKERNDALNSNEFLEGYMAEKDQDYYNSFYISVPGLANSSIPAGYFYDVIQASAYSLSDGEQLFEATENFTLIFYVNQKVQVSIIDEGGTFDENSTSKVLDFGYLTQNAEKGADVRVLSNGSYQLKISSQNNGVLKLAAGESISYSLSVNGSNVNLSSSANNPVLIGSGDATSNAGDRYNMKVKITENTGSKSAGMYQDILRITAIAN